MPSIVDVIGASVINAAGETVSVQEFTCPGKVVGLYFSAHWCPPCRGFTPLLANFYNQFRSKEGGKRFEIVFVSSDKDQESFDEYFKEMPWHSVPFAESERKAKLSKKFKVTGIPSLVLVDGPTGRLITINGRDSLSDDLDGNDFPWQPKTLKEILGGELLKGTDKVNSADALGGKVKGIYFSAHWCPPCRVFTPMLTTMYDKLLKDGKSFEIVFASSDRSPDSFTEYYATMPWLAIPYADSRIMQLTRHFAVEGIPTLLLLNENDEVITIHGRAAIAKDPEGKNFPWPPEPMEELNDSNAPSLNETACLILFTDGDAEMISKAKDLLWDVASEYASQQKQFLDTPDELPDLKFFYEGPDSDEIADSLRTFAQLDSRKPLLAIVDIGEGRTYTLPPCDEINKETVAKLVEDYKKDALQFVPLGGM